MIFFKNLVLSLLLILIIPAIFVVLAGFGVDDYDYKSSYVSIFEIRSQSGEEQEQEQEQSSITNINNN